MVGQVAPAICRTRLNKSPVCTDPSFKNVPDSVKDLTTAATIVEGVAALLRRAIQRLAEAGGPERQQTLAYDLAHASAALETARSLIDYGAKGELEATITCAFVADMVHDLSSRLIGREQL